MTIGKILVTAAAIASLAATPAFAGSATRSSAALPAAAKVAPVAGVRAASHTKKASGQNGGFPFLTVFVVLVPGVLGPIITSQNSNFDKVINNPAPLTGQP